MFNFRHKDKGYGLLLPTIACAALIGGVAVGITKMSNVSVKAVTSTKTKYTGQQYALNTADKYCRLTNYASLAGFEKRKIDGSDDYYEEVIVTDNTVPLFQGSVETGSAPAKDITVNVYHKEGERMPLVSTIKLYRTDPATFDPSFNMVANDAASTSKNQALSANAFREMLNSKVSGDIAFGSDVAMSANATKVYIDRLLKNYALTDSSVGIKNLNDGGTSYRGVFINGEGFIQPTDIIVRGNKTTEADPLILIPVKLPDGSWAFDSLRKSKLGKPENQTYTVTIKQTPNQTITVTTSDGTKHTSDFTAKVGTTWTATVDADTGYNAGKLIASSGTVNGATTVSATEATIKTYDFIITQSAHQTITVTTGDGVTHTSSFVAKYGTTWTAQIVADSGYTAGTLSATSGIVTGTMNVSATEAKKEQDYLFYDIVRFYVDHWYGDVSDEMGCTEESYGYMSPYSGVNSVERIKLSFGYLEAAICDYDYVVAQQPVLTCPIYVPDKNIRDIINDKTISVWFDDYPVVWSRPISYYSTQPNSIYAVWWPDFQLPGCSTENLEGLFNFMRSKEGNEVTLHIKVE